MGLQSIFQNAAVIARKAFGDAFLLCDYAIAPDRADYDATSGVSIWHDPADPLTGVRIHFANYTIEERQAAGIPATHRRAYVAGLDLSTAAKLHDLIRGPDLVTWEVVDVTAHEAGATALWDLQIRPYPAKWPFVDWTP